MDLDEHTIQHDCCSPFEAANKPYHVAVIPPICPKGTSETALLVPLGPGAKAPRHQGSQAFLAKTWSVCLSLVSRVTPSFLLDLFALVSLPQTAKSIQRPAAHRVARHIKTHFASITSARGRLCLSTVQRIIAILQ